MAECRRALSHPPFQSARHGEANHSRGARVERGGTRIEGPANGTHGERAVLDAEAAVVAEAQVRKTPARRAVCTLSCHDATRKRQTWTSSWTVPHDAERDSLTFAWVGQKALTSNCEEIPGRSSFTATPGKYVRIDCHTCVRRDRHATNQSCRASRTQCSPQAEVCPPERLARTLRGSGLLKAPRRGAFFALRSIFASMPIPEHIMTPEDFGCGRAWGRGLDVRAPGEYAAGHPPGVSFPH